MGFPAFLSARRYSMARYCLLVGVYVCVCVYLLHVGSVSKRLHRSHWLLAHRRNWFSVCVCGGVICSCSRRENSREKVTTEEYGSHITSYHIFVCSRIKQIVSTVCSAWARRTRHQRSTYGLSPRVISAKAIQAAVLTWSGRAAFESRFCRRCRCAYVSGDSWQSIGLLSVDHCIYLRLSDVRYTDCTAISN